MMGHATPRGIGRAVSMRHAATPIQDEDIYEFFDQLQAVCPLHPVSSTLLCLPCQGLVVSVTRAV
jgi:hypothetical protein